MLVLTRKREQAIMIGDNIEIKIVDIQGENVKIGINAPRSISIHRMEVYLEIIEENKKASNINKNINFKELFKDELGKNNILRKQC